MIAMEACDVTPDDVVPMIPACDVEWGDWEESSDGHECMGLLDIGDHTAAVSVTVPEHGPAQVEAFWYGDAGELPPKVADHMRAEGRSKAAEL